MVAKRKRVNWKDEFVLSRDEVLKHWPNAPKEALEKVDGIKTRSDVLRLLYPIVEDGVLIRILGLEEGDEVRMKEAAFRAGAHKKSRKSRAPTGFWETHPEKAQGVLKMFDAVNERVKKGEIKTAEELNQERDKIIAFVNDGLSTEKNLNWNTIQMFTRRRRNNFHFPHPSELKGKTNGLPPHIEVPSELRELVMKIKEVIDSGPTTVAALSSRFDVSKKTVIRALHAVKDIYREEEGSTLTVSGKIRGDVKKISLSVVEATEEFPGYDTVYRLLILSNPMLGNKYQQITWLYTIMDEAERLGVKAAIVLGGSVAGKPQKGTYGELFLHEPEELAQYLYKQWPRPNFKTYFLAGQEELSWGVNVAKLFCSYPDRNDLRYLGEWSASWKIDGTDVVLQFVYPHGGVRRTYTLSYRPQKAARAVLATAFPKMRSEGLRDVPRIIFNGRVLAQGEINRGTKTVLCPGMIDQTPSLAAAEVMPNIGAIIVELRFSVDGKLLSDFDERGRPQEGGSVIHYYDFSPYAVKNDYGEFSGCQNCSPHEQNTLSILREQSATIGEISRRLNCSTETVNRVLKSLEEKGFDVKLSPATKRVVWIPKLKESFKPLKLDRKKGPVFVTTSDVHLGSKHQQPSLLRMVHEYAVNVWEAPVILNAGDNFEGRRVYRGQEAEVFVETFDQQLEVGVREWPKNPPTIAIGGNHDESFWKAIVSDLARHFDLQKWPELTRYADIMYQFAQKRPEVRYLGSTRVGQYCTEAKVAIDIHGNIIEGSDERGLVVLFLHPRGAVGQFRSYKIQKFLENLLESALSSIFDNVAHLQAVPHVYLLGNWHINAYIRYGGVDVYILPCLQNQTRFLKELGLTPDLGSWMVRTEIDDHSHVLVNTVKYLDLIPYAKDVDY